jgi:hypothetical protein
MGNKPGSAGYCLVDACFAVIGFGDVADVT